MAKDSATKIEDVPSFAWWLLPAWMTTAMEREVGFFTVTLEKAKKKVAIAGDGPVKAAADKAVSQVEASRCVKLFYSRKSHHEIRGKERARILKEGLKAFCKNMHVVDFDPKLPHQINVDDEGWRFVRCVRPKKGSAKLSLCSSTSALSSLKAYDSDEHSSDEDCLEEEPKPDHLIGIPGKDDHDPDEAEGAEMEVGMSSHEDSSDEESELFGKVATKKAMASFGLNAMPPGLGSHAYLELHNKRGGWSGFYRYCPSKKCSVTICGCVAGTPKVSHWACFMDGHPFATSYEAAVEAYNWVWDQHTLHTTCASSSSTGTASAGSATVAE